MWLGMGVCPPRGIASFLTGGVYHGAMTERLERALVRVRALPDAMQDAAARMRLDDAGEVESLYRLTREEEPDRAESDAEVVRGNFATDDEIRAIRSKHGL